MFCYFIFSVPFTNDNVVSLRKLNDSQRISSSFIIIVIIVITINSFLGHINTHGPHVRPQYIFIGLNPPPSKTTFLQNHLWFSSISLPFPITINLMGRLFHTWENKHAYLRIYFHRSRQNFLTPLYHSVSRRNRKSFFPFSHNYTCISAVKREAIKFSCQLECVICYLRHTSYTAPSLPIPSPPIPYRDYVVV